MKSWVAAKMADSKTLIAAIVEMRVFVDVSAPSRGYQTECIHHFLTNPGLGAGADAAYYATKHAQLARVTVPLLNAYGVVMLESAWRSYRLAITTK